MNIRGAEWVTEVAGCSQGRDSFAPLTVKLGEDASGDALGSLEKKGFKKCLCLRYAD